MKWLLTLLLFVAVKPLKAQEPYKFFQLFLDKGLTDARINAITQDQYGFMWFASANGLNRYDGYAIKTFFADEKNNGLTSNSTTALFSDSRGALWIGTGSGLVTYNFVEDKFERFAKEEPINTAQISCITEDAKGNIYAGTTTGLFWWNRQTKQWKNLSAQLNQEKRFVAIRGLLFFDEHTLYATTENKGFYKIDISKLSYETIGYKTKYADTCCLFTIGMQKMDDSIMLIGTLSLGLTKFNTHTNKFILTEGPLNKSDSILFNSTYQVIKDRSGRFWTANNYYRLAEYLPAKNLAIPVLREPNNPYGFDSDVATCVFEDSQSNIWIGTPNRGVYRFNPNKNRVKFYSTSAVKGGLQNGNVQALAKLTNNLLMVGMDAGPSFYDKSKNEFINYKGIAKELGNLPLEQVVSGLMDKDGIVWMGTNRVGLMRYDPVTKNIKTFSRLTKINPLNDDGVSKILEMNGDSLMLIGFGAVNTFNRKTFKNISFRNDSLNRLPIYNLKGITDVEYDADHKKIWIVIGKGNLYLYDPATKLLEDKSTLLESITKPLKINNLAVDANSNLWLATNRGAIWLRVGRVPKIYTLNKSINTSEEIKNILPVDNEVWLTNSRSLAKLNTINGEITYLGEKDGFTNVQLFSNSLTLSAWQNILIGSNNGFYEIFPGRINNNAIAGAARLTNFKVYDNDLETEEPVSVIKEINLKYNQNFFSFDVSAFDYSEGADIEYAYKLKGFDKDWQFLSKNRSGSYTNVPGGNYVLLLKSRNANGEWNENGQKINIHISKPFWLTTWFLILILAALSALIYFIYKHRIRIIQKEAGLHSEYAIKLNELENSALRTQMSPHFIFNSLNTINSFINRNDPARANQYISKFSKLIRLILDHSREKKITLAEELNVLELYVQLERIRFDNKFNYQIEIDESITTDSTEIPPLIIQPFVENAILHGILPLQEGGVLKVSILKEPDVILCVIEDNGIGRQQAKVNKPEHSLHNKSHGIDITLKRIELFNNEHGFESRVNIIDLKNEAGLPAGTRVEIRLALEESF